MRRAAGDLPHAVAAAAGITIGLALIVLCVVVVIPLSALMLCFSLAGAAFKEVFQ